MPAIDAETTETLRRHRELANRAAQLKIDWVAAKKEAKAAKAACESAMARLREECCSWQLSEDVADRPMLGAIERASQDQADVVERVAGLDAEANGDDPTDELMEAAKILMPDNEDDERYIITHTGDPDFVEAMEAEFRKQDETKAKSGGDLVTHQPGAWHDDGEPQEPRKRRRKGVAGG